MRTSIYVCCVVSLSAALLWLGINIAIPNAAERFDTLWSHVAAISLILAILTWAYSTLGGVVLVASNARPLAMPVYIYQALGLLAVLWLTVRLAPHVL